MKVVYKINWFYLILMLLLLLIPCFVFIRVVKNKLQFKNARIISVIVLVVYLSLITWYIKDRLFVTVTDNSKVYENFYFTSPIDGIRQQVVELKDVQSQPEKQNDEEEEEETSETFKNRRSRRNRRRNKRRKKKSGFKNQGRHIDHMSTLKEYMKNIPKGTIDQYITDVKGTFSQQKDLFKTMKSLQPMIKTAREMMSNFEGILGGI